MTSGGSDVNGSESLSYRQIQVGRFMSGMSGLNEIFTALYERGYKADETTAPELLARARQHNYILPAAEAEYAAALLREFRKFCQQQAAGCACATGYGVWRGHPRETIPWYPTIHTDLCDGCGACLRFCAYGVLAADDDSKVQVVEPFKCVVGCSACARLCKPGALVFPPPEILQTFGG